MFKNMIQGLGRWQLGDATQQLMIANVMIASLA